MNDLETSVQSEIEYAQEHGTLVDPPESGFSVNWNMIGGYGEQLQVTMRGSAAADWPRILKERRAMLDAAQKNGWTFPGTVRPAPGLAPSVPTPVIGAPNASVPSSTGSVAIKVIHANRVDVKPRTDGKLDIEFYEPGHNYPDIKKSAVDVSGAIKLLSDTGDWLPEHFAAAKSYTVKIDVEWRDGKPNSKGQPYKDIVAVKAA